MVTVQQAFGDADWDVIGVFQSLFDSDRFRSSVTTTLWFSLLINPLQILGALALAYALTRRLPATGIWRTAIFLPVAVPPAVASIVWGLALRSPDGLINGLFATIGVLVADTVANLLLFVQVQLLTRGGPAGSTNLLMYEIYQQALVFGDEQTAAAGVLVLLAIMTVMVGMQAQLLRGGADE